MTAVPPRALHAVQEVCWVALVKTLHGLMRGVSAVCRRGATLASAIWLVITVIRIVLANLAVG